MLRKLFGRIRDGLARTRQLFQGLFRFGRKVDEAFLEELEAKLIQADVGVKTAMAIVERVREAYKNREVDENLLEFVKSELKREMTLTPTVTATEEGDEEPIAFAATGPTVILVTGVNGSGKTTSIAKLAYRFKNQGKKVLVVAADTFRAGAVNQLAIWADRIGCDIVRGPQKADGSPADPAAVAHDGCLKAVRGGYDVVIIDTAGRLHTHQNLMQELEKIRRVVARQIEGAPHEVLLVLDATNGQNAVQQARKFAETVACTGIILAKLDGTAKGGAVISIRRELGLPVKYVGVGEKAPDLERFNADSFVEALFA